MKLPSKKEINIYNTLDEISACKHFLNKNAQEVEVLFRENSLYYLEYLRWVGPRAFRFYLQSVINYIKSDYSVGDSDMISCLHDIIKFRMGEKEFPLAINRINIILDYVLSNYDKFDVNEDIFGNLFDKYQLLRNELNKYV